MDLTSLTLENPEISEESSPPISQKDMDFVLSSGGHRELTFGNPLTGGPTTLAAFDTYRQVAASMMGAAFMKLSSESLREFSISGSYNGMWRDVILFGYLCAHDKKTALKAASNPSYHGELMIEWADRNGIELMSDRAETLANFLGQEIVRLWTSHVEVDETGSRSGGESLGE